MLMRHRLLPLLSVFSLLTACSSGQVDTSSNPPGSDQAGAAGAGGETSNAGQGGAAGQGGSTSQGGTGGLSEQGGAAGSGHAGQAGGGAAGAAQAGGGQAGMAQAGGGQAGSGQAGGAQAGGGAAGSAQAGGGQAGGGQAGSGQAGQGQAGAGGGGDVCPRVAGPDDGPRHVIISHPYDNSMNASPLFEVLNVAGNGELSRAGKTFALGTTNQGHIAFTPDGKVGLVAEDDGMLGVFTLDGDTPTVTHAAFDGGFYATSVVIAPDGAHAYVLSDQFSNVGGGVYSVTIHCDGTVTSDGLLFESKLPAAFEYFPGDPSRALIAATDVLGSTTTSNIHQLSLSPAPALVTSADAFAGTTPIVSSLAITHDGAFALIADNSIASDPNRVGVVAIGAGSLTPLPILEPLDDPYDMVASPFDNHVLVASGYSNALISIGYDASKPAAPFTIDGPIQTAGGKPQLPGNMVMIRRGKLEGEVYVIEVGGIRRVAFPAAGGAAADQGLFVLGTGDDLDQIPGAIGVQP
jgi:hypothetical protein